MSEPDNLIIWEPARGLVESLKDPEVGYMPGRCSLFVTACKPRRLRLTNRIYLPPFGLGIPMDPGELWTWFEDSNSLEDCLQSGELPDLGQPWCKPVEVPAALYLIAMGALRAGFVDLGIVASAVKYRGLLENRR